MSTVTFFFIKIDVTTVRIISGWLNRHPSCQKYYTLGPVSIQIRRSKARSLFFHENGQYDPSEYFYGSQKKQRNYNNICGYLGGMTGDTQTTLSGKSAFPISQFSSTKNLVHQTRKKRKLWHQIHQSGGPENCINAIQWLL